MMKKSNFLLLFIALVLLSVNVQASNLDYYLSNSDQNFNIINKNSGKSFNIKRGSYVYPTIVINNSGEEGIQVEKGKITLRFDNSIMELVKYESGEYYKSLDSNVSVTNFNKGNDKIVVNYTLNKNVSGKNKVLEFRFHVLDNAKTGSTKIYQMDGEDTLSCIVDEVSSNCAESLYTELVYNVEKSEINTLSSIKVDGKEVNNFSSNVKSYNITVDGEKEGVNVEATPTDNKASVSGDIGTRSLKYGMNTLNIEVTSESGVKSTYTLYVTRNDSRSKINTLKTLKLSSGVLNFKPETTEYEITVKNEVEEITITSSLTDSKAKYKEDFTKKVIELMEGNNSVQIVVIAENGDEKTYTINITRELSSNNTLKSLTVNGEEVTLFKNAFSYNHSVSNETERVTIKAVPTDSRASIDISNISYLEVGENQVDIYVTAENGDKVCYTLYITRETLLSSNSKLSSLTIKGYKLNFNADKNYYDLKIKEEETLEIEAIPADDKAEVEIEGNKDLINGSVIKIVVRAENNTVNRYFITIAKASKINVWLWVIILFPLVVIGIAIVILLIKKHHQKKLMEERFDSELSAAKEKAEEVVEEKVEEETSTDDEKEVEEQEETKDAETSENQEEASNEDEQDVEESQENNETEEVEKKDEEKDS